MGTPCYLWLEWYLRRPPASSADRPEAARTGDELARRFGNLAIETNDERTRQRDGVVRCEVERVSPAACIPEQT
jgi:hypothetical protein